MLILSDLIINTCKIDLQDICAEWNWLIPKNSSVLLVTVFGDLFLTGEKNQVQWLDTGTGRLTKVADSLNHFEELISDEDNFNEWFLPDLYQELQSKGIHLKENEVYSFKNLPVLGGEYSADNIGPTNMSVHFGLTGHICRQIKDLPDGTSVKIVLKEKSWWNVW